jgi:cytochrome c-type biogenesis protein
LVADIRPDFRVLLASSYNSNSSGCRTARGNGLGVFSGLIGLAILTGLDKPLEAILVSASPAWLTRLSTSFL